MPLRYPPTPTPLPLRLLSLRPPPPPGLSIFIAAAARHPFHTTRPVRSSDAASSSTAAGSDGRNHYETLGLPPEATPAEIKKSFYALSKSHHPDHHPDDPDASRRFMRISEAYSTLSSPAKKSAYDSTVMVSYHHAHHHHHHHRNPHRSGPAGGRPASGLSRRRGTFTGPPPSFYRSGGWGAHAGKRSAAHEDSTGTGGGDAGSSTSSSGGGAGAGAGAGMGTGANGAGGMGPGQDPWRDDVPHFDRVSHERTHGRFDERRRWRANGSKMHIEPETGTIGTFFVICGVLLTSVLVPFTVLGGWKSTKANGSGDDKKKAKTAP